jgi:hypothetical protein
MTAPASELLLLWERAALERPAARAVVLLAPEVGNPELLSVGARNAWLFRLRERAFGAKIACRAECPHCAERVEFEFTAADVLAPAEAPAELTDTHDGFELRFRPPTAGDLAALGTAPDAVGRLFARCVFEARRGSEVVAADELPESVIARVAARLAEADPNADIRLELVCSACRGTWRAPFDIAAFFWAELDHWAQRLLNEVHVLASAYGWCESDILALSPTRRRYYLERVTQ